MAVNVVRRVRSPRQDVGLALLAREVAAGLAPPPPPAGPAPATARKVRTSIRTLTKDSVQSDTLKERNITKESCGAHSEPASMPPSTRSWRKSESLKSHRSAARAASRAQSRESEAGSPRSPRSPGSPRSPRKPARSDSVRGARGCSVSRTPSEPSSPLAVGHTASGRHPRRKRTSGKISEEDPTEGLAEFTRVPTSPAEVMTDDEAAPVVQKSVSLRSGSGKNFIPLTTEGFGLGESVLPSIFERPSTGIPLQEQFPPPMTSPDASSRPLAKDRLRCMARKFRIPLASSIFPTAESEPGSPASPKLALEDPSSGAREPEEGVAVEAAANSEVDDGCTLPSIVERKPREPERQEAAREPVIPPPAMPTPRACSEVIPPTPREKVGEAAMSCEGADGCDLPYIVERKLRTPEQLEAPALEIKEEPPVGPRTSARASPTLEFAAARGRKLKFLPKDARMQLTHPRWTAAFVLAGPAGAGSGSLDCEAAERAMRKCLDAELPRHWLRQAFKKVDDEKGGSVDLFQFCTIAEEMLQYMSDNPSWAIEDTQKLEEEEYDKKRSQKLEEKNADLFTILGLHKTNDMVAMNSLKDTTDSARPVAKKANSRWKAAGLAISTAQKFSVSKPLQGFVPAEPRSFLGAVLAFKGASSTSAPSTQDRFAVTEGSRNSGRGSRYVLRHTMEPLEDTPQRQCSVEGASCSSLRFSPSGDQLAGGFYDGGLRIYNVADGEMLHCLNLPKLEEARDRDGDRDACFCPARTMNQQPAITNLCWRPTYGTSPGSGPLLATTDTAGTISLWKIGGTQNAWIKDKQCIEKPRCVIQTEGKEPLHACAFAMNGSKLLVAGTERIVQVYDMEASPGCWGLQACQTLGQRESRAGMIEGHSSRIMSICTNPEVPHIAYSAGMDRKILIWDLRCGAQPQAVVDGPQLCGDAMDVSHDGYSLLTGSHQCDAPIQIHNLRTLISGRLINQKRKAEGEDKVWNYEWQGDEENGPRACALLAVAWDAENNTIVAAGENAHLGRVYTNPHRHDEPLHVVSTLRSKGQAVWSAAVSRDGAVAAFGCKDGTVAMLHRSDESL